MADAKISALTAASALTGTEVAPVVQSNSTKKATVQQFATAITGATGTNGETVTTSKPRFDLTQTWNASGVVFTGLRFNATDTASAAGSLLLDLQVGGASRFSVSKSGGVDVASTLSIGNGNLALAGDVRLSRRASGVLLLDNNGGTDFNRLQFGGTTASFPSLKRSTTSLQVRLADDSAFTNIQGKLTTETNYTAGDPATTGYLVVYDASGTAYKIPAVAA